MRGGDVERDAPTLWAEVPQHERAGGMGARVQSARSKRSAVL